MPDVTVNIRGKDDGLSQIFDEIKRKAEALGVSTDRLAGFGTKTQTSQASSSISQEIVEQQKRAITEKYEKLHQASQEKLELNKAKLRTGEIDRPTYEKAVKSHDKYSEELGGKEENELKQVEKESLNQLKSINKLLADREKIEREQKQRDNKEFDNQKAGSFYGKMQQEKERLEKEMQIAPDEEGFKKSKAELLALKQKMGLFDEQGGGGGGNGSNALMGLLSGGGLAALASVAMPLAIVAAISKLVGASGDLEHSQSSLNTLNAFSLGGNEGKQRLKKDFSDSPVAATSMRGVFSKGDFGKYGYSDKEFQNSSVDLLMQSGRSDNLYERNYANKFLERGTGINNLAQYSGYDRQSAFGGGTKNVAGYYIKMIEVLSSIKDGSIKKDDLHLMAEKMQIGQQLSTYQYQRQDKIDRQQVISQMASVEKFFGISGKDQRAGDLISGINQASASGGGNANLEYMKWAAARKSHPEMNDEELAGMMEKGLDPEYQKSFFGSAKRLYKEGTFGAYATKKAFLPSLNVDQRRQAMGANGALYNPEFWNSMVSSNHKEFSSHDPELAQKVGKSAYANTEVIERDKQMVKEMFQSVPDMVLKVWQGGSDYLAKMTFKTVDVTPRNNSTKSGK